MSADELPGSELTEAAAAMLTGERWAITDAAQRVPARPELYALYALYALYGDEWAWRDRQLEPAPNAPLQVGKAEESLVSRDLNDHFTTNPKAKPRTGGSTVRRSFAALLREALVLHAVPRNLTKPSASPTTPSRKEATRASASGCRHG